MIDSTKFDKDECVQRLADIGFPRAVAEVFADRCAQMLEHNRATQQAMATSHDNRADPPEPRAQRGTDLADLAHELNTWLVVGTVIIVVSMVVVIKFF